MSQPDLNSAIALYVGWDLAPFPKEDESRLVAEYGAGPGKELADRVRSVLQELNGLTPDWNVHSLASATKWAVGKIRAAHPELDDNAAGALEWIYSWWWK